ncbi:MarR family transcriptional regulator [Pendulispora brunnea]|uniref:MarR family transcriptional regulator n=1 Tax=Pendulispora brunnea TaxID=2905690 RepID=A0ABZ2K0J1_9BACT
MSSELRAQVAVAVQRMQAASDAMDEAAAKVLGINRTDFRACSVLAYAGPMSASALAEATGLSRGAMTTSLDRLERAGYVRRTAAEADRRSVIVELTNKMLRIAATIWGPLAVESNGRLEHVSDEGLATIVHFLDGSTRLLESHAERVRGMAKRRVARKAMASKQD